MRTRPNVVIVMMDVSDYQHRPAYLANFTQYFWRALDAELHG